MKKIFIAILVVAILVVAYWLISPLFISKVVHEELPTVTGYDEPAGAPATEPMLLATGTFTDGEPGHHGSGTVNVLRVGRQDYLRFENDFNVTNGPDLYVYLAKDGVVAPAGSLGELKGNQGSQNYALPVDASILDTNEVIIWCKSFDVNFAIAKISLSIPQDQYLNKQ